MTGIETEKADQEKFKRLKVETLLGLAILAPSGFEDRRLGSGIQPYHPQAIDATIESTSQTSHTFKIKLFVHNFGHAIDAVIFRPKPYMTRQFIIGERNYYYGKIECKGGHCQMAHPQKISSVGVLTPKYKTALRTDVMARLVHCYITMDNLLLAGLPEKIAARLLQIHFPREQPLYRSGTGYTTEALNALKFAELLDHMQRLQKKRRYFPAFEQVSGDWKVWAQTLPFALTSEQRKAIEEIADDMCKDVAARRMIVGDVGSGKTMVILASVMIARPYKAILMAPTTILANQLFEEAQKFLPQLKSVLVTNRTKKGSLEEFDFIIGTHALLYRELPQSALIMIDEQHRFGTAQRNKLEKLIGEGGIGNRKSEIGNREEENTTSHSPFPIPHSRQPKAARPHVLQFSATPIPRTQAMIDSAHIDVSLITQTPFEKDIDTTVIHKPDFQGLMEHIRKEVALDHQVLIVYPLVEQSEVLNYQSIDEARGFWEQRFDHVEATHGKDKAKEEVLVRFRDEGTILLATTVVEVGISLPRLSTVVIVGAERLGLSTLHQLRGRVSRTGLKGYCYLFTHQDQSKRLEAFTRTDNGFDIAQLDLKFRQSGDLLTGKHQSGKKFMWVDMAEDEEIVKAVRRRL